jgi:Tol biopolymer transport system component
MRREGPQMTNFRMFRNAMAVSAIVLGCAAPAVSVPSPTAPAPSVATSPIPSATLAPTAPAHDLAGEILYSFTVGLDTHVPVIANADGTDKRTPALAGRISPDGTRFLLFEADGPNSATGHAATVGVDGSGYKRIPFSDPTLNYIPQVWSPDGKRVAFEGFDESHPSRNGIYTARASDGGHIVRVTAVTGPHDIPADYSPDGTQIVFFRAAREEPNSDLGGTLWAVDVDGSDAHLIETPGVMPGPAADWSPDGSKILFATARAQATGALWTVEADASNLTKVFEDPEGRFAAGAVWSPDGSQIMFSLNPIADWFTHPANGIYVINADGSGLAQVIGGGQYKSMSDWWE